MSASDLVPGAKAEYPRDYMELRQMNRMLRHKLRNLCAGVKMTMDRIAETAAQFNPQLASRCGIINSEMDSLRIFTERMDLLFDALPQPQALSLFDIAASLRESFIKAYPLCSLELEGPELDAVFPKGSLLKTALSELLANAGEAAGAEGRVAFIWSLDEASLSFVFRIENGGASFPEGLPLDPPSPFHTPKSRHDGLGLAIAFRICNEASFKLDLHNGGGDGAAASICIPPGEFANGQA